MNYWISGLLCLNMFFSSTKENKFTVIGKIDYSQEYCGGARPTEDILEAMKKPQPLEGKKIYVRKGKSNTSGPIIAEAITDTSGSFQLKLPNGIYCIVSDNKKDKNFYNSVLKMYSAETEHYSAIDKKCLDDWFKTPDFVFEVKDKSLTISHTYVIPCSWNSVPCAQYKGPFPP